MRSIFIYAYTSLSLCFFFVILSTYSILFFLSVFFTLRSIVLYALTSYFSSTSTFVGSSSPAQASSFFRVKASEDAYDARWLASFASLQADGLDARFSAYVRFAKFFKQERCHSGNAETTGSFKQQHQSGAQSCKTIYNCKLLLWLESVI